MQSQEKKEGGKEFREDHYALLSDFVVVQVSFILNRAACLSRNNSTKDNMHPGNALNIISLKHPLRLLCALMRGNPAHERKKTDNIS